MILGGILRTAVFRLGLYPHLRTLRERVFRPRSYAAEMHSRRFYSTMLRKQQLVYDIGANRGDKTRTFLALGARVLAVEPQTRLASLIAARYGGSKRLSVLCAGVHSHCGRARLIARKQDWLSGFIEDWEGQIDHVTEVDVVTLDALISKYGMPDYIKIDVEGLEMQALLGLSHSVRLLSYEFHMDKDGIYIASICADRLASIGNVRLNVTASETHRFAFSEWFSSDALESKLTSLRGDRAFQFGEVFAKAVEV